MSLAYYCCVSSRSGIEHCNSDSAASESLLTAVVLLVLQNKALRLIKGLEGRCHTWAEQRRLQLLKQLARNEVMLSALDKVGLMSCT